MRNFKLLFNVCLAISCSCLSLSGNAQTNKDAIRIENLISNCVDKAMATSVYIIEYDTLKNNVKEGLQESDGFSGVVVSAEGHILTVSHAAVPKEVYQVRFSNGERYIAKGLGRLGIQVDGKDHDMAMLKIIKPGKWSFAQMGRLADLRMHQALVSISYPGSYYKQIPNVRFGRLTDLDATDGFIGSTTKMEPGDSGGGLFDEYGRVVGIHSWIGQHERENFDVPVEYFLKYWNAMNIPEDYQKLPAEDIVKKSEPVKVQSLPALEEVIDQFPITVQSVQINSIKGGKRLSILGSVLNYRGKSFIVSKNSMIGNNPAFCINGREIILTVISRNKEDDLVFLQSMDKIPPEIALAVNGSSKAIDKLKLGRILSSNLSNGKKEAGILSAVQVDMPLDASRGYFGASAVYQNGKITFSEIAPSYEAYSLLKKGDHVIKINGIALHDAIDYDRELNKCIAGDSITLDVIREDQELQVGLFLSGQPTPHHVSFEYPGGRSERSDGFKQVLIQDAAIKSYECGGPVFDQEGNFLGINIARRSRTSTVIMPVTRIIKYLENTIKN